MKKSLVFLFAMVTALAFQAQSIQVFSSCREKSRVFTFASVDAYSNPIKYHTIGSWCSTKEMPLYRLSVGNYEFNDLPIRSDEEWAWRVEDKSGKLLRKGVVVEGSFWTMLGTNERLTITISPKLMCYKASE